MYLFPLFLQIMHIVDNYIGTCRVASHAYNHYLLTDYNNQKGTLSLLFKSVQRMIEWIIINCLLVNIPFGMVVGSSQRDPTLSAIFKCAAAALQGISKDRDEHLRNCDLCFVDADIDATDNIILEMPRNNCARQTFYLGILTRTSEWCILVWRSS